jgi:tellurite resistance protein TerC
MIWIVFIIVVLALLSFDMLVLNTKSEKPDNKKVAIESVFWVAIAFLFALVIKYLYANDLVPNIHNLTANGAMIKYITGYLIELSLSVDNLFVIAMIFTSHKIPIKYQHRVLFWGILGAIIFRGIFIAFGVVLFDKISWMTYVFGAFLLYTAFKVLAHSDDTEEMQESKVTLFLEKHLKMSKTIDGEKFFTIENGAKVATPLFGALILIEFTDLLFALDSIPAILAVTTDPFIVFSSNIFAVLGLRAFYFFLANMLEKFKYLKYSVFAILLFVAVKLLTHHFVEFPEWFSLIFIGLSLLIGVIVSLENANKQIDKQNI